MTDMRRLMSDLGPTKMTIQESAIEGKLINDTLVKRFHGRSRVRELHLYKLKVDFISYSTTNI